jgi:hypothetical protein
MKNGWQVDLRSDRFLSRSSGPPRSDSRFRKRFPQNVMCSTACFDHSLIFGFIAVAECKHASQSLRFYIRARSAE